MVVVCAGVGRGTGFSSSRGDDSGCLSTPAGLIRFKRDEDLNDDMRRINRDVRESFLLSSKLAPTSPLPFSSNCDRAEEARLLERGGVAAVPAAVLVESRLELVGDKVLLRVTPSGGGGGVWSEDGCVSDESCFTMRGLRWRPSTLVSVGGLALGSLGEVLRSRTMRAVTETEFGRDIGLVESLRCRGRESDVEIKDALALGGVAEGRLPPFN